MCCAHIPQKPGYATSKKLATGVGADTFFSNTFGLVSDLNSKSHAGGAIVKLVSMDGVIVQPEESKSPIMAALLRHRRALQDISFIYRAQDEFEQNGRDCSHLKERLNGAMDEEQQARALVLEFPVTTIEDVAAKAQHIHELMLESDESFDKMQLDMLLRSLIQTDVVATEA